MIKDLRESFRGLSLGEEPRQLAGLAIVTGVLVWIVVFALKESIHWLFHQVLHWIEHAPSVWVLFIPLAIGALIVSIIANFRSEIIFFRTDEGEIESLNAIEGDGIERAIALYYASDPAAKDWTFSEATGLEARWEKSTLAMAIRKFVASLATLGSGGSGGLEASSVLIGENLGAWYYKLRKNKAEFELDDLARGVVNPWDAPNPDYLQTAQLCGVAAAVTVLLGAPLSASIFSSEVMYRDRPLLGKLFYALLAAYTAETISAFFAGDRPLMFNVETSIYPQFGDLRYWVAIVLMGFVIAIVGQLYRFLNLRFADWFQKGIKNPFIRIQVGFAITGAIALAVYFSTSRLGITDHGLELVLGSGESIVISALAGQVTISMALIGLVAKMLATLATIKSGGSAGLLVPTFFFGTMVAVVFAQLLDYESVLFIAPAMTGSLFALIHTPFAAIIFVVEEFGADFLPPAILILIVTGLLTPRKSIYRAQQSKPESLEILPGYDIYAIRVPAAWVGKTLDELDIPQQFDVQVVGLLDRSSSYEQPNVLFGSELATGTTLITEDTILVYGEKNKIKALETAFTQL